MSRFSRLFLAGLVIALVAGSLHAGPIPTDDDDNTYDVDFYNQTSSGGTVYLDGNAVCTLAPTQYCTQTLAKNSGSHTGVFRGSSGNQVSQSVDASTCGQYPGASVNFTIYDDHVEITCNGLSF